VRGGLLIRTNDGTSLDDMHEDTGALHGAIGGEDTKHPLLEIIALELTLIRVAIERWYDAEYGE